MFMAMKTRSLSLQISLILAGGWLSSCVYYSNPVPEMPYVPRQARSATPPAPTTAPEASVSAPWVVTPPPAATAPIPEPRRIAPPAAPASTSAPTPAVKPVTPPTPAPATTPRPAPAPKTPAAPAPSSKPVTQPLDLTLPPPIAPRPEPPKPVAPVANPAPKPTASPTPASQPTDLKKITNDGPIPVATRVEGDPTRVYNPLDPSKTIRIIDKNGNVFPSGKKLKVRGTNYHFYVP